MKVRTPQQSQNTPPWANTESPDPTAPSATDGSGKFLRSAMTKYHCKHCGKTVERASHKRWVKSYCDSTGKTVHLQRVTK